MKNFVKQNKFTLPSILIPVVFTFCTAITFKFYAINLAPLLATFVLYAYARFVRKIEKLPSMIDYLLLVGIIIVTFLAIALVITPATLTSFAPVVLLILKLSTYGISAISLAMIITLSFDDLELSLLFCILISIIGAAVEGEGLGLSISLFCAALSSVIFSYRIRRREQIVRAAFYSALIYFLTFILESTAHFSGMNPHFIVTTLGTAAAAVLVMIIVLPIIVTGVLYLFEFTFRVISNVSLMELSDFNAPLLRKMILEAPGTYQHSLVVANLSESAAEAIGANSLLARVGAYYHDIGKTLKPEYFIENQINYRNAHDTLKPSLSKLIIVNHVKDGVELATQHRLNPRIIDFIQQHHGKTLVQYFYRRAQTLEPELEHSAEEYRYTGPKPQTREIAIVALADIIEALSRTVDDPTPARIEEMIRQTIRTRFMEGELDESHLTLKDIERIIASFTRVVNALFHSRITYSNNDH